jgi:hypothetical protein
MPPASAPILVLRRSLPLLLILAAGLVPAAADAAVSRKKAIAGPVEFQGESQFPNYAALGAGIYQATLDYKTVAPQAPEDPKDPLDPGYDWPTDLDEAVSEGARYHVQVALTIAGGPTEPSDYAAFATAAARRFPAVHLWLLPQGKSVSGAAYARRVNAARTVLKARSARNLIVGSPRSVTTLADARVDLYGFTPAAGKNLTAAAVETLHKRVDTARGKPLKLFLSGWTLQTGRSSAATQLSAGLKVAREASYVYTLGYDGLYDTDKVGADGRIPKTGLLDKDGAKRPAFTAFKNG